jgi:hypothetical protein
MWNVIARHEAIGFRQRNFLIISSLSDKILYVIFNKFVKK